MGASIIKQNRYSRKRCTSEGNIRFQFYRRIHEYIIFSIDSVYRKNLKCSSRLSWRRSLNIAINIRVVWIAIMWSSLVWKVSHLHLALTYLHFSHLYLFNDWTQDSRKKTCLFYWFTIAHEARCSLIFQRFPENVTKRATNIDNFFKLIWWIDSHRENVIDVLILVKQKYKKLYLCLNLYACVIFESAYLASHISHHYSHIDRSGIIADWQLAE